jgi:hypothetical protein
VTTDYMCPNCVTPWKCNGPHIPEPDASWTFTVAGNPPTLNSSYKIVDIGRRCPLCGRGKSTLAKASDVAVWQEAVAWTVKSARPRGWLPGRRTIVEVEWYTAKAHDGSAGVKALEDGMAHGLGCDDKGFLTSVVLNEVDKANPRTVVRVRDVEA